MSLHKKQSDVKVDSYSCKKALPFPIKRAANNNLSEQKIENSAENSLNKRGARKPRKMDKRLWESLSQEQYDAAQQIYYGFKLRVAGMGPRTQVYSSVPTAGSVSHYGPSFLLEKFAIWSRRAQESGISVGCILDILVFGKRDRKSVV